MKLDRKTVSVSIKNLHPFENNPYKVQDGEEMDKLMESIQSQGVLTPLVVRPMADAAMGYEVISGHRRLAACQKLEMKSIPVTIQQMDDDKAMIAVVDANLQREHILPSEKAFAFKMKLEALNHQGVTSAQVEQKLSRDAVAGDVGMSGAQVQRYIRLTNLIPELLELVDQGKIAFTPAVHLSYLKPQEQRWVLEEMEKNACSPSVSQAYHLKEESQAGRLTQELTAEMMAREKANQREKVSFFCDDLRRFFPKEYSAQDIQKAILKMLEDREASSRWEVPAVTRTAASRSPKSRAASDRDAR